MERGFLSQKGSGVGRGVKEKQVSMADKSVKIGMLGNVIRKQVVKEKQSSLVATVSVMESDGMLNDVTPTVEKEKQSSLEDTTGLGSFPPLPIQVNTSAGNALGKSSYANAAGKPSGKKLNIRTLFTIYFY
ncbi:hypothetical protein Tco_0465084 [Tanacetum coccineum]